MTTKEVWIGLANVTACEQPNDILDFGVRGYVNVLAMAGDEGEFRSLVESAATNQFGLKVIEIGEAEKFRERVANYQISDEIRALSRTAQALNAVEFGTFHLYDE